jgi:transposase
MRKLREVIRLRLDAKQSGRAIARSCQLSPATVSGYLGRIADAKLTWPLPDALQSDEALERLLFPDERHPLAQRPEPDWAQVHRELKKKHVTKQLVWLEYREGHPDGYQYSQFCARYARWAKRLSVTMRQTHRAGEKMFIDFSGDGIDIVDPATGECQRAKLFVAVLGASNLTYAEPALSEDLPAWIGGHVRALEYFGGSSEIYVPDNLKSGVKRADNYDPEINPTYAELARHYGAVVMPARKRRPRDKAKVEQAVLLAERWILAVLRNRTFFSIEELRTAVGELVDRLNDRPMKKLGKSRRQLFEEIERASLRPLPPTPYEYAEWSRPRVNIDYHVEVDHHYYSVDHDLIGQRVDVRATSMTVEIFRRGLRITSHLRSYRKHTHTTKPEHMPRRHREYAEWTPERMRGWAESLGPHTAALAGAIMERRRHPEQGFRAVMGLIRLRDRYPIERIERAAARALKRGATNYQSMVSILANNLDAVEDEPHEAPLPVHQNIRGPGYYH